MINQSAVVPNAEASRLLDRIVPLLWVLGTFYTLLLLTGELLMVLNMVFLGVYHYGTRDKQSCDISAVRVLMYTCMFSAFFAVNQGLINASVLLQPAHTREAGFETITSGSLELQVVLWFGLLVPALLGSVWSWKLFKNLLRCPAPTGLSGGNHFTAFLRQQERMEQSDPLAAFQPFTGQGRTLRG
ncbi:MAG: uncharacterized protein KVP18_001550 [Porospora cf. gigantea A]|uniref:uncharacterized protein n=1 Tax=Porospora cf. gigantea A TaxID=2853593 RepID=UPI003559ACF5|nr:MAG: hypothetical protein KVP18_001550 [Porospora cf. gigantea A]